jgi:hypothetical protein
MKTAMKEVYEQLAGAMATILFDILEGLAVYRLLLRR